MLILLWYLILARVTPVILKNQREIFFISIVRRIILKLFWRTALKSWMLSWVIKVWDAEKLQVSRPPFYCQRCGVLTCKIKLFKKHHSIHIQFKQCYDSLCQEQIFNDFFEAGINTYNWSLLWETNQFNNIAVKTPQGISERKRNKTG